MTDSTPHPTVRALATLLALVACLAVFSTAATVLVSSDAARRAEAGFATNSPPVRGTLSALRASSAYRGLATMDAMTALLDSIVAPVVTGRPDDEALRLLASFPPRAEGRGAIRLLVPDSLPWPELTPHVPRLPGIDTGGDGREVMPPDAWSAARAQLRAGANAQWLTIWRRFAGASTGPGPWLPDTLAALRDDPRFVLVHARPYPLLFRLGELNAVAAAEALARGDRASAVRHLRENLAAWQHFLSSPLKVGFAIASARLAQDAERLARLADLPDGGGVARDPQLAAQASRLAALARSTLREWQPLIRTARVAARDPGATLAFELSDDEKLPFAFRAEILLAISDAACLNRREVLFGFDASRRRRLEASAQRLRHDMWPARDGVAAPRVVVPAWPGADAAPADAESAVAGPVRWLLPDAVHARAHHCATIASR